MPGTLGVFAAQQASSVQKLRKRKGSYWPAQRLASLVLPDTFSHNPVLPHVQSQRHVSGYLRILQMGLLTRI